MDNITNTSTSIMEKQDPDPKSIQAEKQAKENSSSGYSENELAREKGKSKAIHSLLCLLAVLIPVIWVTILRIAMLSNGECTGDSFYHAGIAKMGPGVFLAKEFPWTEISIWHNYFADKEMLYHVLLWVIFSIQQMFGAAIHPPFHLPAMIVFTGMISACVFTARRMGIRPGLILAGSLLFCFLAPTGTYRLMMMRPHVLSLALLVTACGIMAKGSLKFRAAGMFILSFIYGWTYSNPHFIVIPALIFALFHCRNDRWKGFLVPGLSLAGVILSMVVHPQFPNTFRIWKIQAWDALISPMTGAKYIPKPMEMLPPGFLWQLTVVPMYVLCFI